MLERIQIKLRDANDTSAETELNSLIYLAVVESQGALEVLERIQIKLRDANDTSAECELNSLIYLLDSPLLSQLLSIEDAIQQLRQVHAVHHIGPDDFDFSAASGELIIHESLATVDDWDSAAHTSSMESVTAAVPSKVVDEAAAQGRVVEHIALYKAENTSLGFSVVGLQSEQQGELGIFVQEIQPGGIAARYVNDVFVYFTMFICIIMMSSVFIK